MTPLLEVRNLIKRYHLPRESLLQPPPVVEALRGVSFTVQAGKSLGIVGESGSGKSTLARQVMALETPTEGSVHMLGRDLNALAPDELLAARRDFQMVFQDPYGSLDPRQRVSRIVADEPVSALDVSVQAQVLNLLAELQESHGVTYLFISHDLAVIDHVCEEVAVMQAGRIVEYGDTEQVLQRPAHAYTQTLLAAIPGRSAAGAMFR